MSDYNSLMSVYDEAKPKHVASVTASHAAMGAAAPQALTMPNFKGGFCNTWQADKAAIDGVAMFLNFFYPTAAVVIKSLEAVGDQMYAASCPAK